MFSLSISSLQRLAQVHPDLSRVVKRAIALSPFAFGVCQGLRDLDTEKQMVAKGKSLTLHSLHLPQRFAGLDRAVASAVDLDVLDASGHADWAWDRYVALNGVMQHAALLEGVPVEWGGSWRTLKDGDHWQLPRARYPALAAAA
jgi:peptidoglycan L-alanyl-D-glutamate endopeptidase CwlK